MKPFSSTIFHERTIACTVGQTLGYIRVRSPTFFWSWGQDTTPHPFCLRSGFVYQPLLGLTNYFRKYFHLNHARNRCCSILNHDPQTLELGSEVAAFPGTFHNAFIELYRQLSGTGHRLAHPSAFVFQLDSQPTWPETML